MANDKQLGIKVRDYLKKLGIETPMIDLPGTAEQSYNTVYGCHKTIMTALGLDMRDDSLQDTPKRVAKMYCQEIFTGLEYENFPACTTVENKMKYDEMVSVQCTVKSMCEHHFMPIIGIAHIAYIPRRHVLGLSKFNRVTEFFSRRPQIQERLTAQIFHALAFILDTQDIAVVIKADHFCVKFRGVEDDCSETTTSKIGGKFRTVDSLRNEFLSLTRA